MWIFTPFGFFSIVSARQGDGAHTQSVDPDRLMVRVRSVAHLRTLQEQFPQLAAFDILLTPGRDYAARIIVPKSVMVPVITEFAQSIEYDNFKGETSHAGLTEPGYSTALHDVWSIMNSFQSRVGGSAPKRGIPEWWEKLARKERAASSLPFERSREAVPSMISPSTRMDETPVLIIRKWSSQPSKSVGELVAAVVDFEQYRKGRVAVRDLAEFGCIDKIPRSQTQIERTTLGKVRHFISVVRVFTMLGVVPSFGSAGPVLRSGTTLETEDGMSVEIEMDEPEEDVAPSFRDQYAEDEQVSGSNAANGVRTSDGREGPPQGGTMSNEKRVIEGGIAAEAKGAQFGNVKRPGPLVEDESVVGGVDAATGAPVIRPKDPEGKADRMTESTDPRERPE